MNANLSLLLNSNNSSKFKVSASSIVSLWYTQCTGTCMRAFNINIKYKYTEYKNKHTIELTAGVC